MESTDEMDSTVPTPAQEEENVSTTYTREQVIALLSRFQATPSDYLIQTYFEIVKIDKGPLYEKFQRRFNHIVFNNLKRITRKLIIAVFIPKIPEMIREDIQATAYVSCIFPYNQQALPCPMFLQFFNPLHGIEHRLVRYTNGNNGLDRILTQYGALDKIVGYCGDFSYNDPGVPNCKSDHFTSLSLLSGRTIKYLPYSDGFIPRLFDILLDYLPEDVSVSLVALGETILRTTSRSQFATNFIKEYRGWLDNKKEPHILLSNYAKFVTENFAMINSYLEPFHCLPRSIEALLCNILQRFLLVFMREIYLKIEQVKLLDNCAVMYYFQLVEIRDLFKLYEESHYIPPRALICFNNEIDELKQNRILHPDTDKYKIDKLHKEIVSVTMKCFKRAIKYISPLLEAFPDFDNFSWVLLKDSSIDENQVHQSYHVIENSTCADCPTLVQEVKRLNSVLSKIPLLEMQDGIVSKWVAILQQCPTILIVTKLLEHLFSLPASYNLLSEYETDCSYSKGKTSIHFNMGRRSHEEVVDNIEEFAGERMVQARDIIKQFQVPAMID